MEKGQKIRLEIQAVSEGEVYSVMDVVPNTPPVSLFEITATVLDVFVRKMAQFSSVPAVRIAQQMRRMLRTMIREERRKVQAQIPPTLEAQVQSKTPIEKKE